MSYVPAKLREIFQTCRLRPENIADRGRFRLGDRKSGHPFRPCRPERGAGDANRRGTLRGRRPAASAGLRGLSLPRKIPFALSFRRKSRRGSRGGNAGSPPSASLDDHDGSGSFFHRKKQRREADPFPCRCIRCVCPRTSEIAGFARQQTAPLFPGGGRIVERSVAATVSRGAGSPAG